MLLQKLVEYSTRIPEIAPPGYSAKAVRYLIELDRAGRLRNPSPIDLSDAKSKRGQIRIIPHVVRSGTRPKPYLLADNAEFTLCLPRAERDIQQVAKRHAAYLSTLTACVQATNDEYAAAVLTFLQNNPLAVLELPADYNRDEVILFRVDNEFPTQRLAIQQFWATCNSPKGELWQCLICGQRRPTLKRLIGGIKGISLDQTSDIPLISANKAAFQSYGLKASQTAPVCEDCADRFTKSLNQLLSDRTASLRLNELTFTFWTREDVGFNPFTMLDDPSSVQVAALLSAAHTAKWQPNVDDIAFYAVSLSTQKTRVVVRDWIDTTVGAVKQQLAHWFTCQRIVNAWGENVQPLSVYQLAGATMPTKKGKPIMDHLPPQTAQTLLHTALTGTPLPTSLLQQALRRNAAEHDVTYPRAALIKLVLASQTKLQEDEMTQLQLDRPEPAYHCGRLLAVLEQIQKAALGRDINTTIVDRFYGAASTAPASVFGPLLSRAQPHLAKLRRGPRDNVAAALQLRLEEVLALLPTFPRTLKLQDQALFALGYYHERAYDRAARAQATQRKANSLTVSSDSTQGASK